MTGRQFLLLVIAVTAIIIVVSAMPPVMTKMAWEEKASRAAG